MKHIPSLSFAAVVAATFLASCGLFFPKPDYKPHDKMAVVPQEFLYSTHEPFTRWLDQAVAVQVTDMPLTEVLQHPALRDLRVRWIDHPKENPKITIHRIAITRRQLLWALAQDNQLIMLAVVIPGGQSYIEIRERKL